MITKEVEKDFTAKYGDKFQNAYKDYQAKYGDSLCIAEVPDPNEEGKKTFIFLLKPDENLMYAILSAKDSEMRENLLWANMCASEMDAQYFRNGYDTEESVVSVCLELFAQGMSPKHECLKGEDRSYTVVMPDGEKFEFVQPNRTVALKYKTLLADSPKEAFRYLVSSCTSEETFKRLRTSRNQEYKFALIAALRSKTPKSDGFLKNG